MRYALVIMLRSVTFFISTLAGRVWVEELWVPEWLGFTEAASKAGGASLWAAATQTAIRPVSK
jgi:hypothetical protein